MSNFWIKVSITLVAIFITSLYTLLTLKSFYLRLRNFFYWVPFTVSIAFLSAYYFYFTSSTNNEFNTAITIIIIILMIVFISYILEFNLFIMKNVWMENNTKTAKFLSQLLFTISFILCIIPFVIYNNITGVSPLVLLLCIPIIFIFGYIWDYFDKSACNDIDKKINKILKVFCSNSYITRNCSNIDIFLENAKIDGLRLEFEIVKSSINRIYLFEPMKDGEIFPGLENHVIPIKKIDEISKRVQQELLINLTNELNKLKIIIGSVPESEEGFELTKKNYDLETANRFLEKRKKINI